MLRAEMLALKIYHALFQLTSSGSNISSRGARHSFSSIRRQPLGSPYSNTWKPFCLLELLRRAQISAEILAQKSLPPAGLRPKNVPTPRVNFLLFN